MTMSTDIETARKVIIENWGYRVNIVFTRDFFECSF